MKRNLLAFTLLELMLVLAIIAFLGKVGTTVYRQYRIDADADAFIQQLRTLEAAVRMYYFDHNGNAGPLAGGSELKTRPALQPYLPANFANSPHPLGGYFWVYSGPEGWAIVSENMSTTKLPAIKAAHSKLLQADPTLNGRCVYFERGGGYALDYFLLLSGASFF